MENTEKGSIARVTKTTDGMALYLCPSLSGLLEKDPLFKKRIVERDWVFGEVVSYPYYFRFND